MGKRVNTASWEGSRGRWRISVQKDGVRRAFYSSTPGRAGQREANEKADLWLDEGIDTGRAQNVAAAYQMYLEDVELRSGTGNYRNEEYRWRVLISPLLGQIKLSSLHTGHLQNVIDRVYKERGLSKKSMMSLRASLVAFVKYCRKNKMLTLVPEGLTIPAGCTSQIRTILRPDDIRTLFSVDTTVYRGRRVFDPHIYAYRFQFRKGLRPGELAGIMQSDIQGHILHLSRSVNKDGEITAGKNANARRSIYLSDADLEILENQKAISNGLFLFDIDCEKNYYRAWRRYCSSNGMPDISLYELRHSFVSLAKNIPEGMLKPVIGHSASMDTWGVYSHEMSGDLEEVTNMLEGNLNEILTKKA